MKLARIFMIGCLIFASGDSYASFGTKPNPEEILKRVDTVRNPSESYEMRVKIGESLFLVWLSGHSRTLVKTLEPVRDRGRDLLMIDEEMWAYIPNLKRPVRISLSQKLTGQAANGDISRMRWSGDYSATLENEDSKNWTLLLQARKKGLTYERIRIWVKKEDFSPQRAEYLTSSGKILKRTRFGGYRLLAGRMRPSRLEIESAVNSSEKSTIEVETMALRDFDLSLFNPQRLGK